MAISKDEVLALAQLARLSLTEAEAEKLGADMSSIIDYVSQVSAVSLDTHTDKPRLNNVMRDDALYGEGTPMAGKEEAIRNAFPQQENGYNVVRKIIEK